MAYPAESSQDRWGLAVIGFAVLSLVPRELRPHTGAPGPLEHLAAYAIAAGLLTFGYNKRSQPLIIALSLYRKNGECSWQIQKRKKNLIELSQRNWMRPIARDHRKLGSKSKIRRPPQLLGL